MERLGSLDAAFLDIEQSGPPVAVGFLMEFDGKPPTIAQLRRYVGDRLPNMQRLRQRVEPAPVRVRQAAWVDVEPDLTHHIRQMKVVATTSIDDAVSKIMVKPLDRDYPLWDLHLVTGYDTKSWAVVWRLHHTIADGQGAGALLGNVIDLAPDGGMTLADAVAAMMTSGDDSGDGGGGISATAERILKGLESGFIEAGNVLAAMPDTAKTVLRGAPHRPSELTGPVSDQRKWIHTRYPLPAIKEARKSLDGVTINDMVLAAVSVGFRKLIAYREAGVEADRVVRAQMPVSLRKDMATNNQVGMLPAPLPVGERDLEKQLELIKKTTRESKASLSPKIADAATRFAGTVTPAFIQALVLSRTGVLGEYVVDTVITNVKGSPVPVYFAGQAIRRSAPIIPIEGTVRINIGITSYLDQLNVGITGDGVHATDIDVLARGICEGFDDLVALSKRED